MGAIAAFVYNDWVTIYPQFGAVPEPMAENFFGLATLYLDNTGCGQIPDVPTQTRLLYLLTAHIAQLNPITAPGAAPAATLVGRISQAAEGSVNVSSEFTANGSPSQAFFMQTQYGAMFWQATAQYRNMRYRALPTRLPGVVFPSI